MAESVAIPSTIRGAISFYIMREPTYLPETAFNYTGYLFHLFPGLIIMILKKEGEELHWVLKPSKICLAAEKHVLR